MVSETNEEWVEEDDPNPFAVFGEWAEDEDEIAYADRRRSKIPSSSTSASSARSG